MTGFKNWRCVQFSLRSLLFLLAGAGFYAPSAHGQTAAIRTSVAGTLNIIEGNVFSLDVYIDGQPTDTVTVTITGYESVDVSLNKTTLEFPLGDQHESIEITGEWDVDQDNEIFTLLFTASGGGYDSVTLSLDVIVRDNINYYAFRSYSSRFGTGENGSFNNTVWLTRAPSTNVTVTITVEDPTVVTVMPSTLTFTPTTYADRQTVTISGVDDSDVNSHQTTAELSASGAIEYTGITDEWRITSYDDDPYSLDIIEGTSTQRLKWISPRSGQGDVSLTLKSSDPDVVTVSPNVLTYPEADGGQFLSYTIRAVDNDALGDASAIISIVASNNHLPTGAHEPLPIQGWSVSVEDDEELTLNITGIPDKINATTPLTATFTFNGDVSGFVTEDVTVTGATKGNFTVSSANTYTLDITPNGNENVTVTVADNSANYGTNTGPPNATTATAIWDGGAPSVSITGVPDKINDRTPFTATFTFDEDVTGFVNGDITVTGAVKGAFTASSATTYTLLLTPIGNANVVVTVEANSATDGLNTGPTNNVSKTAIWDGGAPSVSITGVPDKINDRTPFTVTFTFDEDVTSFESGDIEVTGAAKGTFTASSATTYTLLLTPNGNAHVVVTVTANSATDGLNTGPLNPVTATAIWNAVIASLSIGDASANEGESITFTVTLIGNVPDGLTVTQNFLDGTANSGIDYKENTASLSFEGTAGEAQSFTVETIEDVIVEEDETFTVGLTVSETTWSVASSDTGTGTIINDDIVSPPKVSLSVTPNPVDEGETLTVTVLMSKTMSKTITAPIILTPITAEPEDYTPMTQVVIAANATSGTGTITTLEDSDQDDEAFTIELGTLPEELEKGTPSSIEVTILDHTLPPNRPPTVTISCMPCKVELGGVVHMTATATDPDGDELTYEWSAPSGSFDGALDEPATTWTAPGQPGIYTIRIEVSDGFGGFASAEAEIEVINYEPEFGQPSYTFELPENLDGRVNPVDLGTVSATDPDGNELVYSIVLGDQDRFRVGRHDGVVRYIGPGEDYEIEPNLFELTVHAQDEFGGVDSVKVLVKVIDLNELPMVTATCTPCTVPRSGEVQLKAIATDPDGDPLTYSWSADIGRFTAADTPMAYWTAPTDTGRVEILLEVSDGRGGSASVSVNVNVANRSPVFEQPTYSFELSENLGGQTQPVRLGTVIAEDPDQDALAYEMISGELQWFTVDKLDGAFHYIGPGEDYEIEPNLFELTVRVQDELGGVDSVEVLVEVIDLNEIPTVTVTCTPCIVHRFGEVRLDASAMDPDGDPLIYAWSTDAGEFTGEDSRPVVHWIAPSDTGRVDLHVEVSDGRGGFASATATVKVFNRSPSFEKSAYTFELVENMSGQTQPVPLGTVAALDPDRDVLNYELVSGDQQRFVVSMQEGVIQYIGTGESFETLPNRFGLRVRAKDEFQAEAYTDVTIEVTDINEKPEATNDVAVTAEDQAVTIDVLANDTDPEGDFLRVQSTTEAVHGVVDIDSEGHVIYTPEPDFHGTDAFSYVVSDEQGFTDHASVEMTVLPVNDTPIAVGTIPDQILDEGGEEVHLDLLPYFLDIDGDVLTYSVQSDPGVLLVKVTETILTLTPIRYGPATVQISASDPEGFYAIQRFDVNVSDHPQRAIIEHLLAANARNHLSSLRMALGRRMELDTCRASWLEVMGRNVPLNREEAAGIPMQIGRTAYSAVFSALKLREGVDESSHLTHFSTFPGTYKQLNSTLHSIPSQVLGIRNTPSTATADFLLGWGDLEIKEERCPVSRRWFIWGQGDIQEFEGIPSVHGYNAGYDGSLSTAYLGLDTRLGRRWLVGVALSRNRSAGEWYVAASGGRLTQSMMAIHPYVRWATRSSSVWASIGAGSGDTRNTRNTGWIGTSQASLRLWLIELEKQFGTGNKFGFAILGDIGSAKLWTGTGKETIDGQSVVVNQARIGVDLSLPVRFGGAELKPFGTVHARHDGGAGITGNGIEIAGGFQVALNIIRIDAQARTLAYYSVEGYDERGAAVTFTFGEQRSREGFSFSISPRWGSSARSSDKLFRDQNLLGEHLNIKEIDRWILDMRANYTVQLPAGFKLNFGGSYENEFGGPGFSMSLIHSTPTKTTTIPYQYEELLIQE